MTKTRLYTLVLVFSILGYSWLAYNFSHVNYENSTITPCLIKNITGIPCPSCGITRSLMLISKGQFLDSLMLNPLGYLLGFMAIIFPIWVIVDLFRKRVGFYKFFQKIEVLLRKKYVAIPAIIFIVLIWIRNIHHHL
jgi:hypothetical protein